MTSKSFTSPSIIAYLVGLTSIMLTLVAWHYAKQLTETKEHAKLASESHALANTINRQLGNYQQILDGLTGLFAASVSVDRNEFHAYTRQIDAIRRFPGIRRFAYCGMVRAEALRNHITEVRAEGFPAYTVTPPGSRPEYCPVIYLEPFEHGKPKSFGADILADPLRREAMTQARDSGASVSTRRLTLIGDAGVSSQPGFVIFSPVYRNGEPKQSLDERRKALVGFVYASFRLDELFAGLMAHDRFPGLVFDVYEGNSLNPRSLLYSSSPHVSWVEQDTVTEQIKIAGRIWTLKIISSGKPGNITDNVATFTLIGGFSISAMLFLATFLQARNFAQRAASEQKIRILNASLEHRVKQRTAQLEAAIKELEAFSYSVSHDLRAPLRSIDGFSQVLLEDYESSLDGTGQDYLRRVRAAAQRMGMLIDDLIKLSRATRASVNMGPVDLSSLASEIATELSNSFPGQHVDFITHPGIIAEGDRSLLQIVLENLLGNAWKYSSKTPDPRIEFGQIEESGRVVFFVRDNGAGFDMRYVDKLFVAFQRLHGVNAFSGTGIGLATVQRIITRHGGRVWAESKPGEGATFYFTLSAP
ncbi:MAG: CHASE domain-containing protein [Gammaproteobacteria bacterium]